MSGVEGIFEKLYFLLKVACTQTSIFLWMDAHIGGSGREYCRNPHTPSILLHRWHSMPNQKDFLTFDLTVSGGELLHSLSEQMKFISDHISPTCTPHILEQIARRVDHVLMAEVSLVSRLSCNPGDDSNQIALRATSLGNEARLRCC